MLYTKLKYISLGENVMKKSGVSFFWKFTKYTMVVFNFLASLSSIIGLIYTFGSGKINSMSTWLWIIGLIIFICSLIGLILLIRSEKYDTWKEYLPYAKGLHEILHCLRDMSKVVDDLRERPTKMNKEDFLRMVTHDCIDIMNKLSNILSDSMQCKVRVCLKLNDFIRENETDTSKINLITFARSGCNGVNAALKEQSKKIKVIENTDFEFIFNIKEVYEENRVHYFYKKDLKSFDKELIKKTSGKECYKNSDKSWRKYYNTTIVMPMRYLKESNEDEVVYDIVGFLCVDSKKAGIFEKKNFDFTIEFLKGVSDIMYSYLNGCVSYYKSIG